MVLTRSGRKLLEQQTAFAEQKERQRQLRQTRLRKTGILRFKGGVPTTKPRFYINPTGQRVFVYRSMKEEYYHRILNAPKYDASNYGRDPPICYSSLGAHRALNARPLGRLPNHIIEALNDHYIQITHGLMVPNGDLYNNDDQPVELLIPSVMNERDYCKLIQEVEENEVKSKNHLKKTSFGKNFAIAPAFPPQPCPDSAQHMVHGEIIGVFVIYGSGKIARAVCSRTREIFTAHVLPQWKAAKVIEVIRRLQVPNDITSCNADDVRISELCVSKRTEIIKSSGRFIIFNPIETNTIHTYCVERLDSITEKEVMNIYKKVVEIVRFCHARRVLVRNFKPRNFYLTKSENGEFTVRPCFIQDMSIEEDHTDPQHTRRAVCIPFMAPEMISADARPLHSRSTEIWGLGVLLYILLVGKYPFHEISMPLLFRAIKLKQHKWPINFISAHSRGLVDKLLKKIAAQRLSLDKLWDEIQQDFPRIRCRSNPLLKQKDLIIKMDMFKMYWESYKDRLLPKNVIPINEEYESCKRDIPIASALARQDLREIRSAIRRHINVTWCPYRQLVIDARLSQINTVLLNRDGKDAERENRISGNTKIITKRDVSMNILLPAELYPINEKYHPSQNPVDWEIYTALRDAKQLDFPEVNHGSRLIRYPAPVYRGKQFASS
uniref:Protein kinase domain-containing protein n=1 Tax=Caenorhabditis japonica TaxID=281687 RepID=A0A8R1DXU6_CAEJA